MANRPMTEWIQQLRRVVMPREVGRLPDRQLLEDYTLRGDPTALSALVHRHGPMVWGVCRRVLSNSTDAEDAFQSTFLVMVRKAASIASPHLLANWLYGVAHQTALKLRATNAKRKLRERQVTQLPEPTVCDRDLWSDLQPVLDEELSCLPGIYRSALVLCDLEGNSRKDASRQLGIPSGTLGARLARARVMLARRLSRRGVVLSGGGLAVLLANHTVSAGVPTMVMSATLTAVGVVAAGQATATGVISTKVAVLTEGIVKSLFLSKVKSITLVVLTGLALGGTLLATVSPAVGGKETANKAPTHSEIAEGKAAEPDETPPINTPDGGAWQQIKSDALEAVVFTPDGRYLVGGGHGKELRVWDVKENKLVHVIKYCKDTIRRLAVSPDGRTFAAGIDGGLIQIWNIASGKLECQFQADLPSKPDALGVNGNICSLAYLPGDKLAALYSYQPKGKELGQQAGQVLIWDIQAKTSVKLFEVTGSSVTDMAVSPDGKLLAVCLGWEGLKVWDLERRRVYLEMAADENDFLSRVAFAPDGKTLAVGGGHSIFETAGVRAEGRLSLYDQTNKKRVWSLSEKQNGAFNAIAFTADGRGVLAGSTGKMVDYRLRGGRSAKKVLSEMRRFDTTTGKVVWRMEGDLDCFHSIAASAPAKTIGACDGARLILIDPETGSFKSELMKFNTP